MHGPEGLLRLREARGRPGPRVQADPELRDVPPLLPAPVHLQDGGLRADDLRRVALPQQDGRGGVEGLVEVRVRDEAALRGPLEGGDEDLPGGQGRDVPAVGRRPRVREVPVPPPRAQGRVRPGGRDDVDLVRGAELSLEAAHRGDELRVVHGEGPALEVLLGDPRHRDDSGPRAVCGPAGMGVGHRVDRRQEDDIRVEHRRGEEVRGLPAGPLPGPDQGEDGVAPEGRGGVEERAPDPHPLGVRDDEDLLACLEGRARPEDGGGALLQGHGGGDAGRA